MILGHAGLRALLGTGIGLGLCAIVGEIAVARAPAERSRKSHVVQVEVFIVVCQRGIQL